MNREGSWKWEKLTFSPSICCFSFLYFHFCVVCLFVWLIFAQQIFSKLCLLFSISWIRPCCQYTHLFMVILRAEMSFEEIICKSHYVRLVKIHFVWNSHWYSSTNVYQKNKNEFLSENCIFYILPPLQNIGVCLLNFIYRLISIHFLFPQL